MFAFTGYFKTMLSAEEATSHHGHKKEYHQFREEREVHVRWHIHAYSTPSSKPGVSKLQATCNPCNLFMQPVTHITLNSTANHHNLTYS